MMSGVTAPGSGMSAIPDLMRGKEMACRHRGSPILE